jgi:deoxycytidylate deaminase
MRLAKQVADDNDSCHARKIGVVIAQVYANGDSNVVAAGYNGPPKRTPHCDSREYLEKAFWPKLNLDEKVNVLHHFGIDPYASGKMLGKLDRVDHWRQHFLDRAAGCKTCPRRLAGAPSGTRLELCSCEHAEANAIYNASADLHGCWMFCWCPMPCWDCGKAIINAGIERVYCVTDPTYGTAYDLERTRFLFEHADVAVHIAEPGIYLADYTATR